MNVEQTDDYAALSDAVAKAVIETVTQKPDALICIAGGDTPLGVFAALVHASKQGKVDFSRAAFVGLDEWLGLGQADKGSCREMVWGHSFSHLALRDDQICFFDGLTQSPEEECQRVDNFITALGGPDIIVLGIGMNGHIGFNEPGAALDTGCHIVDLDAVTQAVSVKYFGQQRHIRQGISLGMKPILASRAIILMASGEKKADIIATTVNSAPDPAVPATLLKPPPRLRIIVDKAAAAKL